MYSGLMFSHMSLRVCSLFFNLLFLYFSYDFYYPIFKFTFFCSGKLLVSSSSEFFLSVIRLFNSRTSVVFFILFFPSEQFFMHCIIFSAQDSWLCCLHFNDGGLDAEAAVLSTKGFHRRYFI